MSNPVEALRAQLLAEVESARGSLDRSRQIADETEAAIDLKAATAAALADVVPRELHDRVVADLKANNAPRPRPLSEWSEERGAVLWWRFPIDEPPYVGTPNDCGQTVEMRHYVGGAGEVKTTRTDVGGWPGYHTHWTPIALPDAPK